MRWVYGKLSKLCKRDRKWILMSGKICECGHLKSQHFNVMWDKLNNGKRTYKKWVGNDEGMCSRCNCGKFREKIS